MAIIHQKEVVFDLVLTDKGRELLSQNRLDFSYYAFSDEGIDYSGSLAISGDVSASLDNYVHKDLSFECDQRKNKDLYTFLYTIPQNKNVLPEFNADIDLSTVVDLNRSYRNDSISNVLHGDKSNIIAVVGRATVDKNTSQDRTLDYVKDQRNNALGKQQDQTVLQSQLIDEHNRPWIVNPYLEVVTGIDKKVINLTLSDSDGTMEAVNGFLIEVYLSGADGKLIKTYQEDVVDFANDDTLSEGFKNYLVLDVDK